MRQAEVDLCTALTLARERADRLEAELHNVTVHLCTVLGMLSAEQVETLPTDVRAWRDALDAAANAQREAEQERVRYRAEALAKLSPDERRACEIYRNAEGVVVIPPADPPKFSLPYQNGGDDW